MATIDGLSVLVARLRDESRQAEKTRADRDTVMARLHESGQATHRQLGELTGMAVSGVRAAIDRTRNR